MGETITTVDLMRHGEPVGGERYRGSLDDPLSAQGWQQMRAVVGGHCPWDMVLSSPLIRCAAFAREFSEQHSRSLEVIPDFREIGFGSWEGLSIAQIETKQPQALHRFWQDPLKYPPPGGEMLSDFRLRVTTAWNKVIRRYYGQHLLLVCHGGVIRMLLSYVLEIPLNRIWRLAVPYAAVSRVCIYGSGIDAKPLLMFHAGHLG